MSYNPKKPGRPSQSYHTNLMAGLRLVVGAEVKAGNGHSGSHTLPGLLKILDELPLNRKPKMVRGDCGFGSDGIMAALEARQQPYLFKLKLSKNVKRHIERIFWEAVWRDAGQGWEGMRFLIGRSGWVTPCAYSSQRKTPCPAVSSYLRCCPKVGAGNTAPEMARPRPPGFAGCSVANPMEISPS